MMLTFIRLLLIKILNFGKYALKLCSKVNQKFIEKEKKNSIEKLLSFSKEGLFKNFCGVSVHILPNCLDVL